MRLPTAKLLPLVCALGLVTGGSPARAEDDFDVTGRQELHPAVRLVAADAAPTTRNLIGIIADDLRFGGHVTPLDAAPGDTPEAALELRTSQSGGMLDCTAILRQPSGAEIRTEHLQGPPEAARTMAHQLAVSLVTQRTAIVDTTPLSTLYYLRDEGDHRNLWAADADGGRPRLVLSDTVWTIDPVWSPGTDGLAFLRTFKGTMQAWGFWPATGRLAPLLPGRGTAQLGATLAPGGAVVVQMLADGRTQLVRTTPGGPVALTAPALGDLTPSLTNDGRSVLFASGRSGGSQIFRVGLDGRGLVRLTTEPGFFLSPRALPNGDVALVSRRDRRFDVGVWHARSGAVQVLTSGPGDSLDPVPLGPDHLAFSATRDGHRRLHVMKNDGSDEHPLALAGPGGSGDAGECSAPVWQPAPSPLVRTAAR